MREAGVLTVISCFGWSVETVPRDHDDPGQPRRRRTHHLLPDDRDPRVHRAVLESPVPLVVLDREIVGAIYDSVMTDQYPGIAAAVTHLAEVSRGRIGPHRDDATHQARSHRSRRATRSRSPRTVSSTGPTPWVARIGNALLPTKTVTSLPVRPIGPATMP